MSIEPHDPTKTYGENTLDPRQRISQAFQNNRIGTTECTTARMAGHKYKTEHTQPRRRVEHGYKRRNTMKRKRKLLSPQEYLKTHDNEAFVTVNNRVFSVPLEEIQNARYNYQVAKLNEDNVYEIHQDFIDRHRPRRTTTENRPTNNKM